MDDASQASMVVHEDPKASGSRWAVPQTGGVVELPRQSLVSAGAFLAVAFLAGAQGEDVGSASTARPVRQ